MVVEVDRFGAQHFLGVRLSCALSRRSRRRTRGKPPSNGIENEGFLGGSLQFQDQNTGLFLELSCCLQNQGLLSRWIFSIFCILQLANLKCNP